MGAPHSQPGTAGQTSPILLRATGEQSAPRRLRDKGTRKESEPRGAEPSGGQGRAEPTRSYFVCQARAPRLALINLQEPQGNKLQI